MNRIDFEHGVKKQIKSNDYVFRKKNDKIGSECGGGAGDGKSHDEYDKQEPGLGKGRVQVGL